jgi:phosphoglycerate dehydrogenase-like enzyme
MSYTVIYWNRATEDVYQMVRDEMPKGWTLITPHGETPAASRDQLATVDFILPATWPVGDAELQAAPKLKMVATQGVGHDKIDKGALQTRGIPLAICPAGTIVGVAEHTILLILAVYKRLIVADTKLRQGTWLQWGLRASSFELAGKTLGLVGFGRIGQAVAKRAHAFDATLVYSDPLLPAPPPAAAAYNARAVSLPELLAQSDIVSVHVPASDETRKLLGAAEFSQMKRSAILINTSRGVVLDETALITALQRKTIAAAGLDVFEREPINNDNPLLKLENVTLTPHISAGTVDAFRTKMRAIFANMQRCLDGRPIQDRIV